MTRHIAIWHFNCPDGLTAAYVFERYMLDNNLLYSLIQGRYTSSNIIEIDESVLEGSIVYFLDFCTKSSEQLINIASKAQQVIILDHHKTCKEMLENMNVPDNVVTKYITMEDSGALITWKYFYPEEPAPLFIKYISDNDTWKHELPGIMEFMAWFDLVEPQSTSDIFNLIADFPKTSSEFAESPQYRKGKTAKKFKEILIQQMMELAFESNIGETKFMKVNSGFIKINSELGNMLVEKYKMPAWVWYERMGKNGPELYNSLRSKDDLEDVSKIAKRFLGGGHRNAAGFLGNPNA